MYHVKWSELLPRYLDYTPKHHSGQDITSESELREIFEKINKNTEGIRFQQADELDMFSLSEFYFKTVFIVEDKQYVIYEKENVRYRFKNWSFWLLITLKRIVLGLLKNKRFFRPNGCFRCYFGKINNNLILWVTEKQWSDFYRSL